MSELEQCGVKEIAQTLKWQHDDLNLDNLSLILDSVDVCGKRYATAQWSLIEEFSGQYFYVRMSL